MTRVIELRQVKKSFGGRNLLDVDELALGVGECTLLTGRNGAGKTTLLKIIAGLLAPDTGRIYFGEHGYTWRAAKQELRRAVVYVHQQPYMFDTSVFDNVAYGLKRAGKSRSAVRETVADVLEWSELAHLSGQNARTLSGGEKQRVAVARARVLSPKIMLMDEPTANMDRDARAQTYFLVRRLKGENIGVLLATHEEQAALQLAEHHYRLEHGALHYIKGPRTGTESHGADAATPSARPVA